MSFVAALRIGGSLTFSRSVPLLAIPVNEAPADFVDNSDKYANRLFCACIKREPICKHSVAVADGLLQAGP